MYIEAGAIGVIQLGDFWKQQKCLVFELHNITIQLDDGLFPKKLPKKEAAMKKTMINYMC